MWNVDVDDSYYTPYSWSQTYTSRPKVVISTQSAGVIDVSDDVIKLSVTRNQDAVSTADVALNNYSNALSGRYNGIVHIGDKIYCAVVLNGTEIPLFTGRVFSCPLIAYDADKFDINCQDCIGDLQYEVWCPYSTLAQKTFFNWQYMTFVQDAVEAGSNDSGMGNALYTFLQLVAGMSKNMIYIEKFPDLNDIMKNILKDIVCKTDSEKQLYEKIFDEMFGAYNPEIGVDGNVTTQTATSNTENANQLWAGWKKLVPIGKKIYQNGQGTLAEPEQCWTLYMTYFHYLYKLPWDDTSVFIQPPVYNTDEGGRFIPKIQGGNGGYWEECHNGDIAFIKQNCQVLGPKATAQKGDVVFWWQSPTTVPGTPLHGYGHVAIVQEDLGSKLQVEEQYQGSGGVVSAKHPKNGDNWILAGYIRPNILSGITSPSTSGTSQSDSSDPNAVTQQELENDQFKMFQYLNYDNANQTMLSTELDKYDNLYDNVPLLDYVKSCCQSTMRSFMSLPNGAFCAFVPDYYGFFQISGINNVIDIDDVDLVDYQISMSKSSYVSHVFLLTNEQFGNMYGTTSDATIPTMTRLLESSGIVSFQRDAKNLQYLMNISGAGVPQSEKGFADIMNMWGVKVLKKTDPNIVSHTLTAIEAVKILLDSWANVFQSQIKLAFRPDIYPGLRLHIKTLGIMVYVKSVTHTWTSTSGGSTTVQSCATSSDNGRVGVQ